MDSFRYYIIVNEVRTEIFPSNVRSLQTSFKRVDNLRYSHEVDIVDKITLTKKDYDFVYSIETSVNRCGDIIFLIEKLCNNEYVFFAQGVLRPIDGEYDLDKCKIDIKITAVDPYYCYDYNKEREINIFDAKPYNERAKAYVLKGVIETFVIEWGLNENWNPYDPSKFGGQDPRMLGWQIYRNESWIYGPNSPRGDGSQKHQIKTYYARERLEVPCADPDPGTGWILVSNTCPGGIKVFARPIVKTHYQRLLPNNYDPEGDITPVPIRHFSELKEDSMLFSWDIMGYQDTPGLFDNGILLYDLLSYFIGKYCALKVRSNFFQFNPTATFEQPYPQLPSDGRTLHNIIYQKSDVKRLNASNNATKGITTLDKLINNICTIYNLQYRIEGGYFILEHVSFWEKTVKLDATQSKYDKYLQGTNKYSYDQSRLPQFEEFKMMEAGNPDFTGTPIEYFGRCMSTDESDKTITRNSPIITTDIEYCMENSDPGSGKVSDEGFVLMATDLENGKYYIQRFPPILDEYTKVNNPLSWAHLINSFYRHERPQKRGLMNNSFTDFFTTAPVRKQPTITIPWCCGDVLDLTGLVKTKIGDGVIDAARLNHYTERLELDLLYINPYQEMFCPAPTSFRVNRLTSNRFYFDISFVDCSVSHRIVIEVTQPDGQVYETSYITAYCGNIVDLPISGTEGLFKFRAREVCSDSISSWTDFLEVNYSDPEFCNPLPSCSFVRRKTNAVFVFQFSEPSFTNAVDGEVTLPSGSVSVQNNLMISVNGSTVQVEFDLAYGHQGTVRIFPGEYKFRFRRRCGDYTTSLFGNQINVTVS